jgi:hypothetical protein
MLIEREALENVPQKVVRPATSRFVVGYLTKHNR